MGEGAGEREGERGREGEGTRAEDDDEVLDAQAVFRNLPNDEKSKRLLRCMVVLTLGRKYSTARSAMV